MHITRYYGWEWQESPVIPAIWTHKQNIKIVHFQAILMIQFNVDISKQVTDLKVTKVKERYPLPESELNSLEDLDNLAEFYVPYQLWK